MKLRATIPRTSGDEETLLNWMSQGPMPLKLFDAEVGTVRLIDFTGTTYEIEMEIDSGVDLAVDVGHYTALGSAGAAVVDDDHDPAVD